MNRQTTQKTLDIWHKCVANQDMAALKTIVHEDAVFRSPMAHTPYPGRAALVFALSNVIEIFEDFTYHRELISEDGKHLFLEFSADVNGKSVKGIDLITINDDGLITDFEVMIRPMSGLSALGAAMAPRMMKMAKALAGGSQSA